MSTILLPSFRAVAWVVSEEIESKNCHLRQSARFYHISSINVIKTLEVHLAKTKYKDADCDLQLSLTTDEVQFPSLHAMQYSGF